MKKSEQAYNDLLHRKLTKNEKNRNLQPYINDRDLAVRLFGKITDHGIVYRQRQKVELTRLGVDIKQSIVYFLRLPVYCPSIIKIGVTTLGNLDTRIASAHTYFVDDVELLGFIRTSNARKKESELLDTFGRANNTRHQCELVLDTPKVRKYIEENCESPISYIKAIRVSRFHNPLFQNG